MLFLLLYDAFAPRSSSPVSGTSVLFECLERQTFGHLSVKMAESGNLLGNRGSTIATGSTGGRSDFLIL